MKKLLAVLLALVMTVGIFAACGDKNPIAEAKGYESPTLKAQVEAGTLPKVEDRIPVEADRFVTDVSDGNYGGVFNCMDYGDWTLGQYTIEFLFMLNEDGSLRPNVGKSYEISADSLVYTVKLREGMKWSDGADFTAEDVYFYYYHCLLGWKDGKPVSDVPGYATNAPNWYDTIDENGNTVPLEMKVIDDYTFTMTLKRPKPLLLQNIAIDNKWLWAPKHWLAKYVARKDGVADDPTFPLITEAEAVANANADGYDVDSYKTLGKIMCNTYWITVGRPTIRAWNITNKFNVDTTVTLERNAYYWKVDQDGRQLPYIDTIAVTKVAAAVQAQEMVAGNYDLYRMAPASEYQTLKDGMTTGDYYMTEGVGVDWAKLGIQFNESYADPQYRALFADVNFRQAISYAMNREELCKIVYEGMATPTSGTPYAGALGAASAENAKKWTDFNLSKANEILDGINGLSAIGADGFRTFTEGERAGERVSIQLLYYTDNPSYDLAYPLIESYCKAVGIEMIQRPKAKSDGMTEIRVGDKVMCWMTNTSCLNIYIRPDTIAPARNIIAFYGKYGAEFPVGTRMVPDEKENPGMYKLVNAYNNMITATTMDDVIKYAEEIGALHAEYGFITGLCEAHPGYNCISNNLKNFPDSWKNADEMQFVCTCNPCTWYFEDPSVE